MAATIVFVFFLLMLLRASLSLPISLDGKTVQSPDSVSESELTDRTSVSVLSWETILRHEEDNKLVQNLSTKTFLKAFENFEAVHGKRIKRHNIRAPVLCPLDRIEYGGQCLTKEQYADYNDGDVSESSDDYEAR